MKPNQYNLELFMNYIIRPLRHTAILALTLLVSTGWADVKLPSLFSDHMVLQSDATIPVWGWADPGEEVAVSIAGQTQVAKADSSGKWSVRLAKFSANAPLTLTVKGHNTIVVQDVLVGEVWLASGQSNMQLSVNEVWNAKSEKDWAKYPQIRMFTVARKVAVAPQTDCEGQWVVCSPETVGSFSATAYFFVRDLHRKLQVPFGVINASWGGTPIETWTCMDRMEGKPEFAPVFKPWEAKMRVPFDEAKAQAQYLRAMEAWKTNAASRKAEGKPVSPEPAKPVNPRLDKNYPANLFNGMIAPIIPYAIRGAIWYQGENNAASDLAKLYSMQLSLLIQDWRQRWNEGDFPFAWVQLPNFHPRTTNVVETAYNNWCVVREEMLKTLAVTNTGMAITVDVGEANNIHPKNKQAVGHRLALWALAKVYGQDVPYSGPLPDGQEIKDGEIILSFKHTDGGLVAKDGGLKGFAIAGEDHKWVSANAHIEGGKVIVSSPDVKSPQAVRYAWAANPDCNLYNGAGLPASPFRTDDW
ncbi:MAG: sialate O-acetylesterase [Verrucomicrobiae bacterium]